jgi:hypothetical protein
MTDYLFDRDRLDVYRLSIRYVASAFETSRSLEGLHRHARDQWSRAAQSVPLNIAEGNGKRSLKDRARFLDIARGSALECCDSRHASCLWRDKSRGEFRTKIQTCSDCRPVDSDGDEIQWCLRMPERVCCGDDHEHRDAEHEHEEKPEQINADDGLERPFLTCVKSSPLPR